ncbi:hypothetical protein VTO42DRAFT_6411 [Malbranchea cinnamomea]
MSSKILPTQIVSSIVRPARRRAAKFSLSACPQSQLASQCRMSTTSSPPQSSTVDATSKPRWQYTPPAMKAPVRLRGAPFDPDAVVNSDPKKLDDFYTRMLGEGGSQMLSEEVKWQAVTHKSFDQGRRPYNDRLAYLGKQIVMLQASLALLEGAPSKPPRDPYGRKHFTHPALDGAEILSSRTRAELLDKKKVVDLAMQYGLLGVLRWLPNNPDNLLESGVEVVLNHAMFAIIGAIALEKGGLVANQVTRERILKPLGFPVDVPREGATSAS